ncbi:MAB_1171c family putative transporter [Nocardia suismassiliense]|uniref:MAB_1171c family putative transporter n=1 Tax=Nocardia suismassiliense TaxID=2077092 RepID=UPI000D1D824F|nr:MAB_1171c family putative transporter [Nocardia suismassiliense]
MQFAITYGSIGALAIVGFIWRLIIAIRNPNSPARWALAIAIACSAIGFEAAVPHIYLWIGRTSGIPNLASLIVYTAITTAVMGTFVWTTVLVAPHESASDTSVFSPRRVAAANIAVVAAMVLLFFLSPVHDQPRATDFDHHYGTIGIVAAFLGVYFCAYTFGLVRLVVLCRQWIPQVREQIWLRRGLALLSAGATIAIGYSIGKTIALIGAWAGISTQTLNVTIAPAFASLGAAIMLIGYLCPSVIPQAASGVESRWALYRLRPMWSALTQTIPDLARTAPPARRASRARVYRRVIEIRDALLLLQHHLRPTTTARAERLATELRIPSDKRPAAIEAARIAAALSAYRHDAEGIDCGEVFHQPEQLAFTDELRWLVAVAMAFRTSPLVPAVLKGAGDDLPTAKD